MGTIWVKEFTGGLDARRLPVTTTAGVLIRANNGHINRGGEFEKRAAFVQWHTAENTAGLAAGADGVYVFGHTTRPVGLHAGIKYIQTVHPSNSSLSVAKVLSVELQSAKVYAVIEFSNGDRFLYYDGAYVGAWADAKARGTIRVKQVNVRPAERGYGTIRIKPGASPTGEDITALDVGGVSLIVSSITHTGDHNVFLDDIIDAVNARTGTTGFTADRADESWVIYIRPPAGNDFNGDDIEATLTGTLYVQEAVAISGGTGIGTPTVTRLSIGPTDLFTTRVEWDTNAATTAAAIVTAINANTMTSGYSATSAGAVVTLTATVSGSTPNDYAWTYEVENNFQFLSETAMSGGFSETLPQGAFLKTAGGKVYTVAGKVLYFSGIAEPTKWTTDYVGAGFIDMAAQTAQAEDLTALARYQSYLAIFARRALIIEYIDPDPTLNRIIQTLKNTGTRFPNSVTEFGDADIFYADESGLRSVQSRTNTDTAATADIGVPVDPLISEKLAAYADADAYSVFGLIEPITGNFWLCCGDTIYVFSYYRGAKINAWTTYTPSWFDAGVETAFDVEYAVVYNRKVYVRSGDDIFIFGGTSTTDPTYDATEAEAWLPYMDANKPTQKKNWESIDAAVDGQWSFSYAMDPNDDSAEDGTIVVPETTYGDGRIPLSGHSTHIGIRASSTDAKAAKLSSLVVTFDSHAEEDS